MKTGLSGHDEEHRFRKKREDNERFPERKPPSQSLGEHGVHGLPATGVTCTRR